MKISVIGVGAMGGAMVQGFMKGDMFACSDITASNPSPDALDKFSGTGVNVTSDNRQAAALADIVCVVVKPWITEKVLKEIKPVLDYRDASAVSCHTEYGSSRAQFDDIYCSCRSR